MDFQDQEEVGGSVPQQIVMVFEEYKKSDIIPQSLQNDFYLSLEDSRQ